MDQPTRKPNILFITVDEMRFPMHFPSGIADADAFLRAFMPNLHGRVWSPGVKFSRAYTAASDCTPARGTLVTGLYAHQTWLLATRENPSEPRVSAEVQPALGTEFPTYGKLLRHAGYLTPYLGKWHMSNAPHGSDEPKADAYLEDYGFQGLTMPDPIGFAGQGAGHFPPTDPEVAAQAATWLAEYAKGSQDAPFCLTVALLNPHDKQFFWGGSESEHWYEVYESISERPPQFLSKAYAPVPQEANPRPCGYGLPSNWEPQAQLGLGPKLCTTFKEYFQLMTGGISEDPRQAGFTTVQSPSNPKYSKAVAPFGYWSRALDMYTLVLTMVDRHIGTVLDALDALPQEIRDNTVIVFTSDHGEYASSHGLQGKGGGVYEESYRIPVIVHDPSGRFTAEPQAIREQLISGVDLLPMLVSMGHGGSTAWMTGPYEELYGQGRRLDLLRLLRDKGAAGRPYVVYTTDEIYPGNYLNAPIHVVALRTDAGKIGVFSNWKDGEPTNDGTMELVYYDYTTQEGREELRSTAGSDGANEALDLLVSHAMQEQLRAPMPASLQEAQRRAFAASQLYFALMEKLASRTTPVA